MSEKFTCPRRGEGPGFDRTGEDTWHHIDGTCSYCGSLNPDVLMARIEAGDVEIGPTDKNYKAYVHNHGGAGFKQTYRDCYAKDANGQMAFNGREAVKKEPHCTGPDDCTHWVTRDTEDKKFYYQHLSEDQQKRFIELVNNRTMKIGMPGHFYRLPFFVRVA